MKIKKDILNKIIEHARKDAPVEACGYLAFKDCVVIKHYELRNVDRSHEHFLFDVNEQFMVDRNARAEGFQLCASYHSHPVTPARPSKEDIKLAYDPNMSYVIVSLAKPEPEVKSFKIKNSIVTHEPLKVV